MTEKLVAHTSKKVDGKNVSVYMTEAEHRRLVRLSKRVGLSYSAIIRGLVAAYASGDIVPGALPQVRPLAPKQKPVDLSA